MIFDHDGPPVIQRLNQFRAGDPRNDPGKWADTVHQHNVEAGVYRRERARLAAENRARSVARWDAFCRANSSGPQRGVISGAKTALTRAGRMLVALKSFSFVNEFGQREVFKAGLTFVAADSYAALHYRDCFRSSDRPDGLVRDSQPAHIQLRS